uniref:NADH:ubiquinone reductase (H(+)-translocating) n=1 Tax=Pyura gangelion TaxID=569434 RepID=S0DG82_PYUGA|nr:NADH dehydrogenase subunit 5 [Pyura gangelion]CCO25757.1 NADH dehydrogenase subunit 5 [Pyura gangelion]
MFYVYWSGMFMGVLLVILFLLCSLKIFFLFGKNNALKKATMAQFFKFGLLLLGGGMLFMAFLGVEVDYFFFSGGEYWLNNGMSIHVDRYSFFFFFVGLLVSWSIFNFGVRYVKEESEYFSFLMLLALFLFFMLILVSSGSFLFLFLGWEGVGIMSYVLISWWFGRMEAVNNSLQAIIYNRGGDFGVILFMGLLLLKGEKLIMTNTEWYGGGVIFFFFFLGVVAKSSQFLFHPWLPNAMEGPTPVSSLLHSSTMVVAGVFLMMRMLLDLGIGYTYVFLMGVITSLLGGLMSFVSFDVKKIIAYSTTSQLGFMMMSLGLGLNFLTLFYILMHAFFKAMMFMLSGVMIHGANNSQDVRDLGVYSSEYDSFTFFLMFLGGVVMFGFPFFSSFWIKDLIFENLAGGGMNRFLWLLGFFSFLVTSFYTWRFVFKLLGVNKMGVGKLLYMENMKLEWDFVRLVFMSMMGGFSLLFFWSPLEEGVVFFSYKVLPVFFIFFSYYGVSYLMSFGKWINWFNGYLLGYNSLIHKVVGVLFMKFSLFLLYFDFLFLEFFLPRGMGDLVWKFNKVFWVVLLLVLGVLMYN